MNTYSTDSRLTVPAYVVLGMLRLGARSGYEVKRFVDTSIRHFWALSHPQLYPALKRLEEGGLISGREAGRGERRSRAYELTDAGREALHEWLAEPADLPFELRDQAMLKLFFADQLGDDEVLEHVRRMRRRSEDTVRRLQTESRPAAEALDAAGNPFPLRTLEVGLDVHRAAASRLRAIETELSTAVRPRGAGRSSRSTRA